MTRFQAMTLALTYPQCETDKSVALENIKTKFGDKLDCCVVGHEYHEDGGSHLHVYVKLTSQHRSQKVDDLDCIGGKHGNYQVCKAEYAWIKYCTKDGNYISHNINVETYLERCDNKITRAGVGNKVVEAIESGLTFEELNKSFPTYMLHNSKKVTEYMKVKRQFAKKVLEEHPLYEWQKELIEYIKGPVDSRKITWYCDYIGNQGKSYIADVLKQKHGAFVTTGGKTADIAYAYEYQPIVVFDMSKGRQDAMNYEILENFKNGRIFSTKYESVVKRTNRNHVIVLANFEPDYSALNKDRWDVLVLD